MDTTDKEALEIDELYQHNGLLQDAGDEASKLEAEYTAILAAVKGSRKAKKLAAQFVPKFFKHFPARSDEAINAQLDLCEDDDRETRIHAIRGLPLLCKDTPEHLPKIADVLGQLLLAEDPLELENVRRAFQSLFRVNMKVAFNALFNQITSGEENLRERAIAFVRDRIGALGPDGIDEDTEGFIVEQIRKILTDVTGTEFRVFMDILGGFRTFRVRGAAGANELAEIIVDQAELDGPFEPTEPDNVDRLLSCLQLAVMLFERGASNSKFLKYIGEQVLGQWASFSEEQKLTLAKSLAHMSPYSNATDARMALEPLLAVLREVCPLKPAENTEAPKLNFTLIESVLYACHMFATKCPGQLPKLIGVKTRETFTGQPSDFVETSDDMKQRHQDLVARLTYVEQQTRDLVKQLREALHALTTEKPDTEEAKKEHQEKLGLVQTALRETNNILPLAGNLRKNPPKLMGKGDTVTLSWLQGKASAGRAPTAATPRKRTSDGSGVDTTKKSRGQLYVPPNRQSGAPRGRGLQRTNAGPMRGAGWRGARRRRW